MATEVFRTNVRQEGSNSGIVTKTIRSNIEQIVNTGIESKYFTAGQVGQLRFRNLAEFSNLLTLKTFSEYKGKVPAEEPVLPPVTRAKELFPPAIELPEKAEQPISSEVVLQSERVCEVCRTKMILASDTNSSGKIQQMYLCPKCGHEQDTVVPQLQSKPVKEEKGQPRRRSIVSQVKTNEVQ